MFISFEGGDGAGKTTQIKMTKDYLEGMGLEIIQTREPGGCESADMLRKLLVEGDADRWDGLSELLLYSVARHEHLRRIIRPAIKEGKWVITDRFADSTTVYQSCGRGVDNETVQAIHHRIIGDSWPDITILLDIEPERGIGRTMERKYDTTETRFESLDLSFHHKVRNGFLKLAEENPERFVVINADQDVDSVHADIKKALQPYLKSVA